MFICMPLSSVFFLWEDAKKILKASVREKQMWSILGPTAEELGHSNAFLTIRWWLYTCIYIYTHMYLYVYMYINTYIYIWCPNGRATSSVAGWVPSFFVHRLGGCCTLCQTWKKSDFVVFTFFSSLVKSVKTPRLRTNNSGTQLASDWALGSFWLQNVPGGSV